MMQKKKFDHKIRSAVAKELGNYVYVLIDPRNNVPFYVGRGGKNTRFDDHGVEAESSEAKNENVSQEEQSRKIERIQEIRSEGLEYRTWIVRYNLGEQECKEVEAALIDALTSFEIKPSSPGETMYPLKGLNNYLTNARRELTKENGQERGIRSWDDLIAEKGAEPLDTSRPLFVRTLKPWVKCKEEMPGGKLCGQCSDAKREGYGFKHEWVYPEIRKKYLKEIGDSVRGWWRISEDAFSSRGIEYAVAVYDGVTRALFEIIPDSIVDRGIDNRRAFEVRPVIEGPVYDEVIGEHGKLVPNIKQNSMYWPSGFQGKS